MVEERYVDVEIVGEISAGRPTSPGEVEPRCIRVDLSSIEISPSARTFALLVKGDSMDGAHILDGDTVVFEHRGAPPHRAIVAAFVDGEFPGSGPRVNGNDQPFVNDRTAMEI